MLLTLISFSTCSAALVLNDFFSDKNRHFSNVHSMRDDRKMFLFQLLLRYNDVERELDAMNLLIKSIRNLPQQSSMDDGEQFIKQCQVRELQNRRKSEMSHEIFKFRTKKEN